MKPAAVVLDPDRARRNSVVRLLVGEGWHAEPYETFEELLAFWPNAGVVFAHDDENAPGKIFDAMGESETWRPLVLYSVEPQPSRIVDAVTMGAMDYLGWPFSSSLLRDRLQLLAGREASFARLRQKTAHSRKLVAALTPREREVLLSLAGGASNKSIARALHLSPRTVEVHRASMMSKLGAKHMSEAIAIVLNADLSNSPAGESKPD